MRGHSAVLALAFTAAMCGSPRPASAIDVGAGLSGIFIGNLKHQVSDLIAQARATGDFLIWRAGETLLQSIEAWEHANSNLIDKADQKVTEQQKTFFDGIEAAIKSLQVEESRLYTNAQQITVEWSQIGSRLVALDGTADVFSYNAKFVLPEGEPDVRIGVDGPQLGSKGVTMTDWAGRPVDLTVPSAIHIDAVLKRSSFNFDPEVSQYKALHLTIANTEGNFWQFGKKDPRSRDLTLWVLPVKMAHITVEPRVRSHTFEVKTLPRMVTALKARDETKPSAPLLIVPDAWKKEGYVFDIEAISRGPTSKFLVATAHDGGGLCLDIDPRNVHEDHIDYSIYAEQSRGGDATVFCTFELPVKRPISKITQGALGEVDIGWLKDKRLRLPEDTESYVLTVTMYNGRSYTVTSAERINPMGLLTFLRDGDDLIIRPTPPRD